ncbi:prepilin-type N-terminal cleavage/methylation domain-containing protein, partial [archaeon]|nr:prepilin-type N-terminal cleavage/methylation domain-containing protein [archaeon]
MMKKIAKENSGLTLLELMIVLTLSLILLGATYMSYQVQHLNSISQKKVMTVQQDIRAVMD